MGDQADKVFKMMRNSPIPEMIQSLGKGFIDAQRELDNYVLESMKAMADPANGIQLERGGPKKSMLELGMIPSFYHFQEATISVKLSLSSMEGTEKKVGASASLNVGVGMVSVGATLTAEYSNKYSFEANAASEINAKIVTVPAPQELKDLVKELAAKSRQKS